MPIFLCVCLYKKAETEKVRMSIWGEKKQLQKKKQLRNDISLVENPCNTLITSVSTLCPPPGKLVFSPVVQCTGEIIITVLQLEPRSSGSRP